MRERPRIAYNLFFLSCQTIGTAESAYEKQKHHSDPFRDYCSFSLSSADVFPSHCITQPPPHPFWEQKKKHFVWFLNKRNRSQSLPLSSTFWSQCHTLIRPSLLWPWCLALVLSTPICLPREKTFQTLGLSWNRKRNKYPLHDDQHLHTCSDLSAYDNKGKIRP